MSWPNNDDPVEIPGYDERGGTTAGGGAGGGAGAGAGAGARAASTSIAVAPAPSVVKAVKELRACTVEPNINASAPQAKAMLEFMEVR